MIVKDEEKFLPSCLESVRDYVDEIIIVDTGSTDGSVNIAEAFGAHVFHHPWGNDFAKHRNQSISYATGQWILILDGDEEIVSATGELIRTAVRDPSADSVAVQVVNPYNGGRNMAVFNSVRLFRNNGRIQYEGIVHNKEVGCRSTVFYPIRIVHHGYNLDSHKMRRKFERTTALLRRQIADCPEDAAAHHYLAISYLSAAADRPDFLEKAVSESLTALKLARDISHDDPVYLGSHYTAGASLFNMGRVDEAEAICTGALEACHAHLDSCYLLAKIYDQKGDHRRADEFAKKYFAIREDIESNPARFGKVVHNSFWATWRMTAIIGKAAYEKGDIKEAKRRFNKAVSQDIGQHGDACKQIGQFYFLKGAFKEAEPFLKTANQMGQDKISLYMLAECYGRQGDTADQIASLAQLIDHFPEELDKIEQIGLAQFARSNYPLAAWCLERVQGEKSRRKDLETTLRIAKERAGAEQGRGAHKKTASDGSGLRISACLMVKNEETQLPRCLDSLKQHVDEIIVVDTGSTDRTVEIAKSCGAVVFHHAWQGDFSLHRNQSMSYATGAWILIIDADEILDANSGPALREVVRGADGNAILCKVINYSADGKVLSMANSPRLFRNHAGCHYKDIVHNQACYPGKPDESALCIYHYGYGLAEEKMVLKRRRTRKLLEKQIAKNPRAPFPRYNLTVLEFMSDDFKRVVEEGRMVIQLLSENGTRDPAYANVFYYVAAAYNNIRNLDQAEKYAREGLKIYPGNLDLYFVLTVVSLQKGDYASTIDYGKQYLSIHEKILESPAHGNLEYNTIGHRRIVNLNLGRAYHHLGDGVASSRYHAQASAEAPAKTLSSETGLQHGTTECHC